MVRRLRVEILPFGFCCKGRLHNTSDAGESEILHLIAKGMSYREISDALDISEYTVKTHIKNIFHKLHLDNHAQLVRYVYEHSWMGEG